MNDDGKVFARCGVGVAEVCRRTVVGSIPGSGLENQPGRHLPDIHRVGQSNGVGRGSLVRPGGLLVTVVVGNVEFGLNTP
jgi:hypothetical protein